MTIFNGEHTGIVVIGRNEGERLHRCLSFLSEKDLTTVYVDSGSTDDSVSIARSMSIEVVELDMTIPFTAARARNEGLDKLKSLMPNLAYVQFIDGDCELIDGWLEAAVQTLEEQSDCAAVCGRLRERHPDRTLYNRLCDLEWDTPVGEVGACGGIAMMRVAALSEAGGFNPTLIAGEEPELCFRMRQKDWIIIRIDEEMALHDANMTSFSQWWKRGVRAGHAYAERGWIHRDSPERYMVREIRSIINFGCLFPIIILAATPIFHGWNLLLFGVYLLLIFRVFRYVKGRKFKTSDAVLYSLSCVFVKFAQALGVLKFRLNRLLGKQSDLIEYK